MPLVDIRAIQAEDSTWKPPKTDELSSQLSQLWEDCSSDLTLGYLRELGVGNPDNRRHPYEASITKRMVDAVSVVYGTPATRMLSFDSEELEEDDPFIQTMYEAFRRSAYDLIWQRVDAARNLFRTAVVEWAEDPSTRSVGAMVYGPHQVFRKPNASHPHAMEMDEVVLLQIRRSLDVHRNLYRAYIRDGDMWRVFIVDQGGEPVGPQPYGGEGTLPTDGLLPLQLVHDEHPMFRAWLPIPQSRISFALGINALINDINYLVQQEAHSIVSYKTDGSEQPPNQIGPGTIIKVPYDGDVNVLGTNPKIGESISVLDQQLRLWAISEYLPGDTFADSKQIHTGEALKVSQHHLSQKRWRQLQMVPMLESKAWKIYSRLHNAFAGQWGISILPEEADLRVYPGRAWQPFSVRELQEIAFKNMAAGLQSAIQVTQELFGLTREQAIKHLERVRKDNEIFNPAEFQNAGAMVDGQKPALGPNSASPNPDAFNPNLGGSSEGASVVDNIRDD